MIYLFGHKGFVGSRVLDFFKSKNVSIAILTDDSSNVYEGSTLIYCAGVTNDFRERIYDTFEAHVGKVLHFVKTQKFERIIYLSSARIYKGIGEGLEQDALSVHPLKKDDTYNISKICAESFLMHSEIPNVFCLRLSNVLDENFEKNLFLEPILRDVKLGKSVTMGLTSDSTRDFVHVDDVCDVILKLIDGKGKDILNVASGESIRMDELIKLLGGSNPTFGKMESFQKINTTKLSKIIKHSLTTSKELIKQKGIR